MLATEEGTIISVRKHNGHDPPNLAGCSVKLKVVKRGERETRVALCDEFQKCPPPSVLRGDRIDLLPCSDLSTSVLDGDPFTCEFFCLDLMGGGRTQRTTQDPKGFRV